ncbi:MAG: CotH kinase family protein [Balneolaceae bacterium]
MKCLYKNIPIALVLILIAGCSIYHEEINIDVQNYENLSPSTIETSLKVVNLVVDQKEFDHMYSTVNEEVEIEGRFNLYRNGKVLIEDELVELELKGTFSVKFPLKSLGVKFDKTYDNSSRKLIDPDNLPFHDLDKIKAFRLRNSGNDFKFTLLKDMSLTQMAIEAGLDLDLSYSEQTVVFVNNSFLGLMNLRTESNANGMSRLYDVGKSRITLAKIVKDGIIEKKDGDFERIDQFFNAINEKDYDYLNEEIDTENFIDYMIYQSYIGNIDWPHNNVRLFSVDDAPFRFVLFDLDLAILHKINSPPQKFINSSTDNPITDLFNLFYENEEFKADYDTRYEQLIESNLLDSKKFEAIVEQYKDNIKHLIPTQIEKHGFPKSMTEWLIDIERVKSNFSQRKKALKK